MGTNTWIRYNHTNHLWEKADDDTDESSTFSTLETYIDCTANLQWTASGTNPSFGNAPIKIARYHRVGSKINFLIIFTWGSTTTEGTGTWYFNLSGLPINATYNNLWGTGNIIHTPGTPVFYPVILSPSAGKIALIDCQTGVPWTGGSLPITFSPGDVIRLGGSYEL